jgi:hypothetical protein
MILNNCTKIEKNPLINDWWFIYHATLSGQVSCDTLCLVWCVCVHPSICPSLDCFQMITWEWIKGFFSIFVQLLSIIKYRSREHLMILPVFVGVHTASALFFVAFVFNSVYLFCPCYFYCLFVCTLSIAFLTCDFLDLIISYQVLRKGRHDLLHA